MYIGWVNKLIKPDINEHIRELIKEEWERVLKMCTTAYFLQATDSLDRLVLLKPTEFGDWSICSRLENLKPYDPIIGDRLIGG